MYIKIHRGTAQIGGNIIEIGTEQTKLIFDAGTNLPPLDDKSYSDSIEIEGLTFGKPQFDGVFISHYHNDHCGLIDRIIPSIRIFSGAETHRVLEVISDFTDGKTPNICSHFTNCLPIQLDDIKVTPIAVDHSAKDAYMFLIQADDKNVLYTGDYRTVEAVETELKRMLGVQGNIDVLISEGTNIMAGSKGNCVTLRNESQVENQAKKLMEEYDGTVFVLCSSTNEDRICAIHKAAEKARRTVCEDLFLSAVRNCTPINTYKFMASYIDKDKTPRIFNYFNKLYEDRELMGAESLAKIYGKKVIFVRTSMIKFIKKYLDNCPKGGRNLLIYSMWQGYKVTKPVKEILSFCDENDIDVVDLHCSGHAYQDTIEGLIHSLNPRILIPIHCQDQHRQAFLKLHNNCFMLNDGELLEV